MSDPRNTVNFTGIRNERETFIIDNSTITYDVTKTGGSAAVGKAVTLSTDSTVALTADGNTVLGRLEQVYADLKCVVTTDGYVKLPAGNGATVTAGSRIVGALGAASAKGYIRNVGAAGASPSQAEVNEIAKARHQIIDASTTTAVVVLLD